VTEKLTIKTQPSNSQETDTTEMDEEEQVAISLLVYFSLILKIAYNFKNNIFY